MNEQNTFRPALYYNDGSVADEQAGKRAGRVTCVLCPHHCHIPPDGRGLCRVRVNREGRIETINYGAISSIALDPIEKKPLYHFHPGSTILSLGTVGCNLRCPFCQNWAISQEMAETRYFPPEELVDLIRRGGEDCIGVAFTYSEPVVWYEYVLDGARLVKEAGYATVLVSNGFIEREPLQELLPFIDAMNIDVKSFRDEYYRRVLGGGLEPVKRTVELAARQVHVEITTLLVPGENDSVEEIEELVGWVASIDPAIPLHFSRYFPQYKATKPPTSVATILRAREISRKYLYYVYLGNVAGIAGGDTLCPECKNVVIGREGFEIREWSLTEDLRCSNCGRSIELIG